MLRRTRLVLLLAAAVAAVSLAGCGDDGDTTSTSSSSGTVTVSDPWARTSAGGATMGAAYMVINGGSAADRLVSASAPTSVSKSVEIHETVAASGSATTMAGMTATTMAGMSGTTMAGMGSEAMTMRPVKGIDIPAKGKVELKPGGYHIMFVDLAKPLAKGDTFTLTLTFEKAGKVEVPITVRDAA